MEQLTNCPNCGGYLNDSGRCEFCGSKVYDFVGFDFDKPKKTYIRLKYQGKIVTFPVYINNFEIDISSNTTDIPWGCSYLPFQCLDRETGTLSFEIVGPRIIEDTGESADVV